MNQRHKDGDWKFPTEDGRIQSWTYVSIAVLMDIRDELKKLNQVIGCGNAIDIPNILRRIDVNTKKRKRVRKVAR